MIVGKSSGGGGKTKWWFRFPKEERTQPRYMYMSYRTRFCEIWLRPKQDITFHGFGIYSNYYKYSMHLVLHWGLDDVRGEEKEVTLEDNEKEEGENNWHVFLISKVGDKPF